MDLEIIFGARDKQVKEKDEDRRNAEQGQLDLHRAFTPVKKRVWRMVQGFPAILLLTARAARLAMQLRAGPYSHPFQEEMPPIKLRNEADASQPNADCSRYKDVEKKSTAPVWGSDPFTLARTISYVCHLKRQ